MFDDDAAFVTFRADRLGMSEEDRAEVVEKVTILIHIAATVRFQERLKNAINLNILGVKRMVELAHDLKQCDSFVHCSTAYTHAYKQEIGEPVMHRARPPRRPTNNF